MPRTLLGALSALTSVLVYASAAQAQLAFTNPYIESHMRPYNGPQVPYDGASFSDRYGSSFVYHATPLMLGGNPGYLWNLYHADKIARAKTFGYQLPAAYNDGFITEPLPPNYYGRYVPGPAVGGRGGLFGFGWFCRHHDE